MCPTVCVCIFGVGLLSLKVIKSFHFLSVDSGDRQLVKGPNYNHSELNKVEICANLNDA